MSSASIAYTLSTFTGLTRSSSARVGLLRDEALDELDAQVQSGDLFALLATRLDAAGLRAKDVETRVEIEDVVSDLLYLQDHYSISKKDED